MFSGIIFKNINNLNINLFGEYIETLRRKKGMEIWDLAFYLKQKGIEVEGKTIRKWEKGLEFPDINIMYKLSEIFKVEVSVFLQLKNQSLSNGYNGIDVYWIKCISYLMGISMYTAIWGTRIILGLLLLYALYKFWDSGEIIYQRYLQTGKPVL